MGGIFDIASLTADAAELFVVVKESAEDHDEVDARFSGLEDEKRPAIDWKGDENILKLIALFSLWKNRLFLSLSSRKVELSRSASDQILGYLGIQGAAVVLESSGN